ncbi:MAG: methylmalonyl-CoA mutase small subunit, partial [Bacteroidales bacterium]|nr:methylmalonyl-CoA mutase small subunit [Bacteroidales bacterium]
QQDIDKTKVTGSFDYDPITYLLLHNKFWKSKEEDLQEIVYLQQNIGKQLPNFNYISSNGNILHNCGTTIVQELAYSLAIANEYIVFATEKGLSIDDIAPHIQFTFSIASNYFMEIAKLRVGRMLWASIVEAYNPSVAEAGKINCYSISSSWNKTMYDSNVNMLRATTEGMAAAIGGTDAILLAPFDETYKDADSFSQRLAKNIQVILKEEAHFDKVNDPAAGSYYIENLTHSMANEVWNLFLEIENTGGLIQSAMQGKIKEAVEASCQKRNMDIATRKIVLLGTNQYPNTNESMIDKISLKPIATYKGLQPYRGAIPFEELRLATEKWAKKHGRPKVFLFKIGNLAMRQARAGFISNFFGCAGYEIIETPGYKTAEEGLKDVKYSNPHIVVICSSDEEYDTFAPEITEKIKSFNPSIRSVVAGNPVDSIEKLKTAGIDDFIHVRLNVLETLRKYNKLLGIE